MKKLLTIFSLLWWLGIPFILPAPALAQCTGLAPPGSACGNNTQSSAFPSNSQTQTLNGDAYFGSGRPWCDVRAKGALGDGATDDSAAFAACVAQLSSGGIINVPPGNYCVFSGISITGSLPIALTGAHRATEIQTCEHDVALITLNNANHEVLSLTLVGANNVNTTNDTISLLSGCVECRLEHLYVTGGRYVLNDAAADVKISDIHFGSSYGAAVVYSTSSFSCNSCKIDTNFPVSTPSYGATEAAWQSTYSYSSVGTIVQTAGSQAGTTYNIQLLTAGTSGGSAPTLQPYGTNITDGTAVWQLVGAATNAAVQLDTGSSTVVFSNRSDLTGPYTYGLYISGNAQSVSFTNSTIGDAFSYGIYSTSTVGGLVVVGSTISNCIQTNCIAIYIHGTPDEVVSNNIIFGNSNGVVVDSSGTNYAVTGNQIFGASVAGIYFAGTTKNISITANIVGTSTNWGINAIGIDIAGTNDYYNVAGNICHGATTCFSDTALGSHRHVEVPTGTVIDTTSTTTPQIYGGTSTGSNLSLYTTSDGSPSGDTLTLKGSTVSCGITNSWGCVLSLAGASGGATILQSATSASGTATLPANTGTLAETNLAQTFSANQTFSAQIIPTFGVPTISSGNCGATTNGSVSGNNQSGLITIGSATTTTCTISFSTTINAPSACLLFPANATAAATGTTVARVSSISTTNFVVTGSALASSNYYYHCF